MDDFIARPVSTTSYTLISRLYIAQKRTGNPIWIASTRLILDLCRYSTQSQWLQDMPEHGSSLNRMTIKPLLRSEAITVSLFGKT